MHIRFQGIEVGCLRGEGLYVADYAPPTTELDAFRSPYLRSDGVVAGRDWLRDAAWSFELTAKGAGTPEVLALAAALESAWKAPVHRAQGLVPLEYSTDHGGTWHQVLGRPGRFTGPKADYLASTGIGQLNIQFEQLDPRHFSSELSSTTIHAAPSTASGGWVAPFVFPLGGSVTGEVRAGTVFNAGDKPAPVTVTFYGPCEDPRVWAGDVSVGYSGALAADQWVRVDALSRSVVAGGYDRPQVPVPGRLVSDLGLVDLVAPPGWSDWSYAAKDPTGSSRAVISWRSAFTSMQYGGL